jgi:hypothetical protein
MKERESLYFTRETGFEGSQAALSYPFDGGGLDIRWGHLEMKKVRKESM